MLTRNQLSLEFMTAFIDSPGEGGEQTLFFLLLINLYRLYFEKEIRPKEGKGGGRSALKR